MMEYTSINGSKIYWRTSWKDKGFKATKAVFIRLALFHERILGEKTGKTNPKQWFDD